MKLINNIISFAAKITKVGYSKVEMLLEDGSKGILYSDEISDFKLNLSYIFYTGQRIYVRKKQSLFDKMFLVSMKGLLKPESLEDFSGDELYGIVCSKLERGNFVQITPHLQVCIYGVYLPYGTKVLVSLKKNKNSRIKAYLSSVIYDEYIIQPIFSFQYQNMECCEEQEHSA